MTAATERLDVAVRHRLGRIDLDVEFSVGRETLALIGVSGAGKSSVLLAIAGLLRPDSGAVTLGGRPLLDTRRRIDVPPEERGVGLVFQHGALFPHLTVAKNVAYGLRHLPGGRRERRARVQAVLERYAIAELASSKPDSISGGERQRVALARAVATEPGVLLLDEPLSALDAVTKARVTSELSRTLTALRLPTVLVSHDLEDVAGLADRVAVMDAGHIVQMGTTGDLLSAPASAFVAAFVGTNYFAGTARRVDGGAEVQLDAGGRMVSGDALEGRVGVVVAPWHVSLGEPAGREAGANVLTGPVAAVAPRGDTVRVSVASVPPVIADVSAPAPLSLTPGAIVSASWTPARARLVPADGVRPARLTPRPGALDCC